MPFHLPAASRREFLTAALAGVLTWRDALGGAGAVDPDRWALLADTHVAADREKVHLGARMADNLTRVVAELAGLAVKPAGVVIDGDVAFNKGEPGDYRLLAELLKPLAGAGLPVHLTLGNHDHRAHFRAGLEREAGRSPLAARHVAVLEAPRANWFLLDSLDKVNATPGELGKEQLDWLCQALDARANKPALVVLHHNLHWPLPEKPGGMLDSEKLFAAIVPRRQVKAVVFGHTHVWKQTQHEGIHLINLPPVAYVFHKDMPSGWVDARLRDGGAILTLHALDPKHTQNGETVELTWR
jgi:Icc protein